MVGQIQKRLFTVSEYYKMAEVGILQPDQNVELINGEILQMSPQKSFHAGVVDLLAYLLREVLDGHQYWVRTHSPVALNNFSEPEPDLAVVKRRSDFYRNAHPQPADIFLIIEVSDTTLKKDRQIKLPLYAAAGIQTYWIVNLGKKEIEVYELAGSEYQLHQICKSGDLLKSNNLNFALQLSELFG